MYKTPGTGYVETITRPKSSSYVKRRALPAAHPGGGDFHGTLVRQRSPQGTYHLVTYCRVELDAPSAESDLPGAFCEVLDTHDAKHLETLCRHPNQLLWRCGKNALTLLLSSPSTGMLHSRTTVLRSNGLNLSRAKSGPLGTSGIRGTIKSFSHESFTF
ncbi:hypothetical protein AVEN_258849-1 [Araneus ventricosus]|uniref:Uncharacterized protein n=1 Tax=Araneus ventricosus TaxID=182803 RepID=A0A4Y2PJC9_ARAVE|nr:hypothetical protein AVEN_258849-1 [Araneus ventricosus]